MAQLTPHEHFLRSVKEEFFKEYAGELRKIAEELIYKTVMSLVENLKFDELLSPADFGRQVHIRYVKEIKNPPFPPTFEDLVDKKAKHV